MKKFFVVTVLLSILFSCQESKDNAMQRLPKRYDKSVGEQIPLEVAYAWIKNFDRITMAGRTSSAYSINAADLAQMLGVVSDRLGVVLHHGMDDSGDYHLLMVAMDYDGDILKNDVIDLSDGKVISKTVAKAWTEKYGLEHPDTPWYHFFGIDIFSEILSDSELSYIDIVRGLNENKVEQILLFVYSTNAVEGGRDKESSIKVYDVSQGCPPCSIN